ncbi:MAG: nitroreductase [Candidatus Eremiobacteraeota bacterium]|nr:nitroreductase [Candidatus Eremiobacteraeota bacterium]
MQVTQAIRNRRSVGRSTGELSKDEIAELIEAAVRAPNHHLTEPWTFTVLSGAARERFGNFWGRYRADELGLEGEKREGFVTAEAAKPLRAPTLVIVSTRTDPDPVIASEDFAATAAAVQNLLLAAEERGLAAMWRTGDAAYHPAVKEFLSLEGSDRIVAFVYLGRTPAVNAKETPRATPRIHWLE